MKRPGHKKTIPFWLCLIASIGLLVGGFFTPPMGIIDGSCLKGAGLLFMWGALAQLPIIIEVVGYAKIQRGDTTIEISKEDDNNEG